VRKFGPCLTGLAANRSTKEFAHERAFLVSVLASQD
jgi:hypothetical protein